MHRRYPLIIVAALAVFFTSRAIAQSSFGTILGRVVDQSGAVVPNAPVEVKDTATGVISKTVTQGDGNYTVINLVPGPYEVSVALKGFKKTVASGTLVANQQLQMNLTLLAGRVTETVNVSATGQLLDTETGAVTSFINSQQIANLPLSSRNFSQLLVLNPATLATGQTFGGMGSYAGGDQSAFRSQLSGGETFIGGQQSSANQYLIDGVNDNDLSFQTPTITPSIDAIAGIRQMNSNYPAAFAGSASQINLATKSGTNQYHGTLYEFFRNDFLDATNFFSVRDPTTGRVKPVLRYNQFGGSLGGPITIPKIINGHSRLFFFFNYEGTRTHSITSDFGLFPTPQELQGNFAGDLPIYNPATGQPFPNNQIPTTDINSTAAKIIQMGVFPTPNTTGESTFNFVKRLTNPDNIDQYLARVDAHISAHDSLFVRWAASKESIASPALDAFGDSTYKQQGKNLAVSYTHIFSPSLVNEFRAGLNRPITLSESDSAFGPDLAGQLFKGTDPAPATYGLPYMTFQNFTVGANPNAPLDYYTTDESPFGSFPHTYFGLEPGTSKEGIRDCLARWDHGDNGILDYSKAYRLKPGTGWFVPPGVLHAPGSLLTYEPQWGSDVLSMFQSMVDGREIKRDLLVQDVPSDKYQDLDFLVSLADWPANLDPSFKQNHYLEPIPVSNSGSEGYVDRWVVYGRVDGQQRFSARELTVAPGARCTIRDNGASGLIVTQGHGSIGKLAASCPACIRFGELTEDELFISYEAATNGIVFENHSSVEPFVTLRYFGPDVNPDMPNVGDHARHPGRA